jgi:hypothetical protein
LRVHIQAFSMRQAKLLRSIAQSSVRIYGNLHRRWSRNDSQKRRNWLSSETEEARCTCSAWLGDRRLASVETARRSSPMSPPRWLAALENGGTPAFAGVPVA